MWLLSLLFNMYIILPFQVFLLSMFYNVCKTIFFHANFFIHTQIEIYFPKLPFYLLLSRTYLSEHGLAVMCYHGALITVQSNTCVMEGFLRMFEVIIQLRHASLEYTSKVAWDQRPAYCCNKTVHVYVIGVTY